MRVFLVYPPVSPRIKFGALDKLGSKHPPLGLVYLGTELRKAGHEVRLVDADLSGQSEQGVVELIKAQRPGLVGFSAVTSTIDSAARMASAVKAFDRRIHTVVGGCHVSAMPEETMRAHPSFDVGFLGEAEATFPAWVGLLDKGDRAAAMKGTVRLAGDGEVVSGVPEVVEDMDGLSIPDFGLIEGYPSCYAKPAFQAFLPDPCAYILLTRGCVHQCIFCNRDVTGRRQRHYSPERCVEILERLRCRHGARSFILGDENFSADKGFLTRFCGLMAASGLGRSPWCCSCHVNNLDEPSLKLMRGAGCAQICLGLESGSQRIQDILRKGIRVDRVPEKLGIMRRHGIGIAASFMIGNPGETAETLEETLSFIDGLPLDFIYIWNFTPFPGTPIWPRHQEWGRLEAGYADLSDSNPTFIPHGLTRRILDDFKARAYRRFYLSPRRLRMLAAMLGNRRARRCLWEGARSLLSG